MKRLLIALILTMTILAPVAAQQGSTRWHPDDAPPSPSEYGPFGFRAVYWPEMPHESEVCAPEQAPPGSFYHYPVVLCWPGDFWTWAIYARRR